MAIEVIDLVENLQFIPSFEKDVENPTIIHLSPTNVKDSLKWQRLFVVANATTKAKVEYASDEIWLDYFLYRIEKIENIILSGELKTIESKPEIKSFLEASHKGNAHTLGRELMEYIMLNRPGMTEEQVKN